MLHRKETNVGTDKSISFLESTRKTTKSPKNSGSDEKVTFWRFRRAKSIGMKRKEKKEKGYDRAKKNSSKNKIK